MLPNQMFVFNFPLATISDTLLFMTFIEIDGGREVLLTALAKISEHYSHVLALSS